MEKNKSKLVLMAFLIVFAVMMCGCRMWELNAFEAQFHEKRDFIEEIQQPQFKEIDIVVDDIYYYYKQLSSKEQLTYRRLLDGILNADRKILLEETEEDSLDYVMLAMLYDHPEIFWCEGAYEYIIYETHTELYPTYTYIGDELTVRKDEIDVITGAFLNTVDMTATDYDKVKMVYEYVINSVDYEENVSDDQNIYSSIVNKKSVCAGYARAVQYLLQQMDMECIYAIGTTTDGEGHGWNIVKCDELYYQVDATYGDRDFIEEEAETEDTTPEELQMDYSYLCCTDMQMYVDRQLDSLFEVPVCDNNDLNYYKQAGCYFEDYTEEVLDNLEASVFQGEKVWECQFANQEDYQEMLEDVENGVHGDIVGDYLEQTSFEGEYYTWYTFDDTMYTIACWY